jgi:Fibronectin type III domain
VRHLSTGRVVTVIALVVVASVCASVALVAFDHSGAPASSGTGNHSNGTGKPPIGPPPVSDPANCTQGTHSVHLGAGLSNERSSILADYAKLGAEGGGTLYLGSGTFTINQTLNFLGYSNVSIQGAGMGSTVLALPPNPVGNFSALNGTGVGQYNLSLGGPVNGTSANFIEISGPAPVDNFEMCNLAINAEANNASEDWAGSLIYDMSGGSHHVYSDVAEDGFFGPSTSPNGLHLEPGASSPHTPSVGYVVDGLYASDNTVPFEHLAGFEGGPNFLNLGAVVNCTLDEVNGIGLVAFEVAPPHGCTSENWAISGHMLIDPGTGGSWGGSVFENVSLNTNGTASPNALGISVNNGTGGESSNFTNLRWNDDTFVGTVLGGPNMISVDNSTFWGGIDPTPPEFSNNLVYWADQSTNRLSLPISVGGSPTGGQSSVVSGDSFVFPNGTGKRDPFELTVTHNTWADDAIAISGDSSGFLLSAPGVALTESSTFSQISYDSLGNNSPVDLLLLDELGSPGFDDLGAAVWELHGVFNDLPILTPSPASDVRLSSVTPDSITVEWAAASGPVTNYTVLTGSSVTALVPTASVGNTTSYVLKGLEPDELVYVSVEAWNGSRASAPAPATFTTTPDWTPGVPSGLTDSAVGPYSISLMWDTPTTGNVSNYTVLLTAEHGTVHTNFSVGIVTEYTVSGLGSGVEYTLQVEAWNASWTLGPGAPISLNTTAQGSQGSPPPPPTPPSTPSSAGSAGSTSNSHPLSLGDWVGILGVAGVILLGIVAPVAILSRLRTGRAAR